ncbi:MAG: hypothetical protein E3K32_07315 [wastewater metagenome]|nr:hypothetical protein [Candidatus Loosdrechtia aerotolerans]
MKTVITTVGTSLFTNYLKEKNDIRDHYKSIKDKIAADYERCKGRIDRLRPAIMDFLKKNNNDASAEIKSILKLKDELKDDIEVRLIASDSLESIVAAEILTKNKFTEGINISFNKETDVIKGLQVVDPKNFAREGMTNLINRVYSIANGYFGNMILNMTGGFKATVPFLTIFGQVNNIPLYYIFEKTETLIKIPQVPINIDWKIFDNNSDLFSQIEREGLKEIPHFDNPQIEAILERIDSLICFNPLGVILWERYKTRYELFYLINETKKRFEKLTDADRKTIRKSFLELSKRLCSNPADRDLKHSLTNCNLPDGFYCFRHKEDDKQVRILWHKEDRTTTYDFQTCDIYIASFWLGKEVHNAEAEYVDEINRFSQEYSNLMNKLNEFKTISIEKEVTHV